MASINEMKYNACHQLAEFIKKLNFSHFKELNKTTEELKEMHIYIDCSECKMLKNTSSSPTRAELFSEDFNNTSAYKKKVQSNRFSIPKFVLSSNSDISDEEVIILRTKKRKSVCVRKQEISSGSSRSSNDDKSDNDKTSSSDSVVEERKSNSKYLNKQRNLKKILDFNTTDDNGSSNNDNEKDDDKTSSLQSPDDYDNSVEEIKSNSIYLHKDKNFKNTVDFIKTDNSGSSDDDDDETSSLQSPDESNSSVEEIKSNNIYLRRGRNFKNTVDFSKTNSKELIFKIDNSGSSDDDEKDDEKNNDETSSLQSPDDSDYSVEEIKSNSINLYKNRNLKNTVDFIERDKKQLIFKQGTEECNSESDNEVNFNQETKHDTSESGNEDNSLFVPLKQTCKSNNYSATECIGNEEKIGMVKIVSLAKTLCKSKNEENFDTVSNALTGKESVHEFVLPKELPSNIQFPKTPKQSIASNNQAKAVFKTPKSAVKDVFDRFTFKSVPGTPSYKRDFYKIRDQFVVELFSLFNKTVFDNKLPADLRITWNKRMTKTAGFCYYSSSLGVRNSSIELSDKVIDSTDRIRDTLIHELCHAAVWLLDGVKGGHGPRWKYWAKKGNRAHPDLPVISRCHQYEIHCKYKYKCDGCGVEIGRHSKSIDSSRHQCIRCGGTFELTNSSSASKRTPNAYAMFVKNNFAFVKKNNPSLSHKEVMMKISADFREIKLNDVDKENSNT